MRVLLDGAGNLMLNPSFEDGSISNGAAFYSDATIPGWRLATEIPAGANQPVNFEPVNFEPVNSDQPVNDEIEGLVAWWEFDQDAFDAVGNAHGLWENGANIVTNAQRGNVAKFDGRNDAMSVDHENLAIEADGEFSVAFWFRRQATATGQLRNIVHQGSQGQAFSLAMNSHNNRLRYAIDTGDPNNQGTVNESGFSNAAMRSGKWTHIALVKNDNHLTLYLNGQFDSSITLQKQSRVIDGTLYVSGTPWNPGTRSHVDDLRIYDRAILDSEIQRVYNNGRLPTNASGHPGYPVLEIWKNRGINASDGRNYLELDSSHLNLDRIYQEVATVAGQSYDLAFDLLARNGSTLPNSSQVDVYWDGELAGSFSPTSTQLWQTERLKLTAATTGTTRLEFREVSEGPDGGNDSYGPFLDNVRLFEESTVEFLVADGFDRLAYQYGPDGQELGEFQVNNSSWLRGATTEPNQAHVWFVDLHENVHVYHSDNGQYIGSWHANGTIAAQGITTDGADIWVVDAIFDRVYQYADGAQFTDGNHAADNSFRLHRFNRSPSGIAHFEDKFWVTDDFLNRVFIYDTAGQSLGYWRLDANNRNSSGIAISDDGADLFVTDNADDAIFVYESAAERRSGSASANRVIELAASNGDPEGIARFEAEDDIDTAPPVITVGLSNDTGVDATDGITSDLSVSGLISDESNLSTASLSIPELSMDEISILDFVDATTGQFSLPHSTIENLIGQTLDDGSYALVLGASDEFGHTSLVTLNVVLDTQAAVPTIWGIDQDTGLSHIDGITNDNTPTLFGTADPNSIVHVHEATIGLIGTLTAAANGDWAIGVTSTAFQDGPLSFFVTGEDLAGNVSPNSNPFAVVVDTMNPAAPQFDLDPAYDTEPVGDSATTTDVVSFVGTTDSNTQVELLQTGDVTISDTSGLFSFAGIMLQLGANPFTTRATDLAGNAAEFSTTITRLEETFRIVGVTSDTGASNTDAITNDQTLEIFGIVDTANPMNPIEIHAAGLGILGTADPSVDGTWLLDLAGQPFDEGIFSLTAVEIDPVTQQPIRTSSSFELVVDLAAPSAPMINLDPAFETVPGETMAEIVTLIGVSEPFAKIEWVETAQQVTADAEGHFSLSDISLRPGEHQYDVRTTDLAGNPSISTVSFTRDVTLTLAESDYISEAAFLVDLSSLAGGSRTISFGIETAFDTTDQTALIEDVLLVYLVDPNDPSQTILDRSESGTALLQVAGDQIDFVPGLVTFDGHQVDIDVSSLDSFSTGLIVFQLINSDADFGSSVTISRLSNAIDVDESPNPVFSPNRIMVAPAGPLDTSSLTVSTDIEIQLENIQASSATGTFAADLKLRNTGAPVGRRVAVLFPNLPDGVSLANVSGTDANGAPYLNMADAILSGGLDAQHESFFVRLEIDNPAQTGFSLRPVVLVGGSNQAPVLDPIGPITVSAGGHVALQVAASDVDNDQLTFFIRAAATLPTGRLSPDGRLSFTPSPDQLGTYAFEVVASDGFLETSIPVSLEVVADPITTTRISGSVLTTGSEPIPGLPVELGDDSTVTAPDGSFEIEITSGSTADTLLIRGGSYVGPEVYPFIAEKIGLLLERELYQDVSNVIARPIYLPALDVANGVSIDPAQDTTVTTPAIPAASVFVAAGTLDDQSGNPFTGNLSITEVPPEFTPAALPANLFPDIVVTIQPGEMVFNTPAPLNLPNLAGYLPGTTLDLWSINPTTGLFDNVGTGVVSPDGSVVETVAGGINNSSWHFFSPEGPTPKDPEGPRNENKTCNDCPEKQDPNEDNPPEQNDDSEAGDQSDGFPSNSDIFGRKLDPRLFNEAETKTPSQPTNDSSFFGGGRTIEIDPNIGQTIGSPRQTPAPAVGKNGPNISGLAPLGTRPATPLTAGSMSNPETDVSMHAGALHKKHELVTYDSLGISRGLVLTYDSERADAQPIVHVGFDNTRSNLPSPVMVSALTVFGGDKKDQYALPPGFEGLMPIGAVEPIGRVSGKPPIETPQQFAAVPPAANSADAAVQPLGLLAAPSGVYGYVSETRIARAGAISRSGTTSQSVGQLVHVNESESPFGAGWGIAGLQKIVENYDGSVLLIDGDGGELQFKLPAEGETIYDSPAGDFTELEQRPDGTFVRTTTDMTVYEFDANNHLALIQDRNQNLTQFQYSSGQLQKIIDPVGLETVFSYEHGLVKTITDPALQQTVFNYDDAGNLIGILDPDATLRQFAYDASHLLTAETDKRGHREEIVYDFGGRVMEVNRKDGSQVKFSPIQTQGLLPLERQTDPSNPPVAPNLSPNAISQFVDANGNVKSMQLDRAGQRLNATDGSGLLPAFDRNDDNLVTRATDGRGNQTFLTYDDRGNVTSISDPISRGTNSQPLFPGIDYKAGANPIQVVSGDLNGDGFADAVTANHGSDTVTVFLGAGNGQFGDTYSRSVTDVRSLKLVDMNGDADLDIVTANLNDLVTVLINDGNGNFPAANNYAAGDEPNFIEATDLDQDGDIDLVAVNFAAGSVSILLNNGDGTMQPQTEFSVAAAPVSAAIGDFDKNGTLDIVTAHDRTTDNLSVLFGNGDGTFGVSDNLTVDGFAQAVVRITDIDNDSNLDIVSTGGSGFFSVTRGNGDGTFQNEINYPLATVGGGDGVPPFQSYLAIVDADNDGDDEVLIAARLANTVTVFENDGTGILTAGQSIQVVGDLVSLSTNDFDLDGQPDVVVLGNASRQIGTLLGNGDATFTNALPLVPADIDVGDGAQSVVTVDLNHDEILDIVTADSNTNDVSILLGLGDATYADRYTVTSPGDAAFVIAGDLNNDDNQDLIVINRASQQVSILLGDGTGDFAEPIVVAANNGAFQGVLGDLDDDGDLDLVIGGNANFAVVINNGDNTFQPGIVYGSSFGFNRTALGDLDDDGILDLVLTRTTSSAQLGNRVRVRLGNGDGTFRAGTDYQVSGGGFFQAPPTSVQLADVDDNGALDILTTDADSDRMAVLLGNGNGTFQPRTFFDVGGDPREIQIADFNNDQILDFATANRDSNSITIRLGDGSGDFPDRFDFQVGDGPTSLALADLNADGAIDFVAANRDVDTISLRLNSGTSAAGATSRIFEYDPVFHQVTRMVDELGNETLMEIDPANGNTLSVTQVIGDVGEGDDLVTQYAYTPDGLVATMTDPLGRVTDYDYDADGRMTRVTFAVGTADQAFQQFEYDAAGNTTTFIDELQHRTEFEYDDLNRITRVIEADPDGPGGPLVAPETTYDYDDHGNLTLVTDALLSTVSYEYDDQHRVIKKFDTTGNFWEFTHDDAGNLSSLTDRIGRTTTYAYDDRNRLIRMTDAAGFSELYTYDADNNRISTRDRRGSVWQTTYDSRDRPVTSIDALGQVSIRRFDRVNNLTAEIDELTRRTEFEYDDVYRLTRVTQPDPDHGGPAASPVFEFAYDAASNLRFQTDALGNVTEDVFDNRDRTTRQVLPDPDAEGPLLSPTWDYEFDAANRLTQVSDPLDRVTTFTYDDLDRITSTELPDPDGPGPDPIPQLSYTYDAVHNARSMSDTLGNTTLYDYDDLYRLTRITAPDPDDAGPLLSPVTTFGYDHESQLTTIADPLNRVTSFAYDAVGRISTETLPDPDGTGPDSSPVTTFTYDGVGNELSITDALGNETNLEYDDIYRLTRILEPDPDGPTGSAANPVSRFIYDAADQLVRTIDPLGRMNQYVFDDLGRVIRHVAPDPDGTGPDTNPIMSYVFDSMSNQLSLTDALGNETNYAYDHLYRLTGVTQEDPDDTGPQGAPTIQLRYDIASQLTSATDPLGRVTTYAYDDLSRVIRELYPDPDGAGPLAAPEMSYVFDLMDNALSMTDAVGNLTQYAYDNLYRLTSVIEADPDGTGPLTNPVSRFTYDIASQMLTASDPLDRTTTYAYDDLRRVTRVIQPDPDGAGPLLSPEMTYVYDLVNNELSMTDPLGHVTAYEYDNLYRVIRRTEEDLDDAGPLSNPVTEFSYDLVDNLLSLTDPVGNRTDYQYDDLDRMVVETIELGLGNPQSRRFDYDLMHNLTRSTDRNERVIEYDYDRIYRMVEERWLDAASEIVNTIEFAFDEASQILRAEDVTIGSRYDYTYDDLRRVTRSIANNGGPQIEFNNIFDAQSRLTEQTTKVGGTADFRNTINYDSLNRPTQLVQTGQPGGSVVADKRIDFSYNADNQLTRISRYSDLAAGNLVVATDYGYDDIGRLTGMSHGNSSSTLVDYDWAFDSASRITQFVSSIDGASDYNYDNINQLVASDHTSQPDELYTYDENGNRTNGSNATEFFNRQLSDGVFTFEYDDEGNRTKRTNLNTGEVTDYTWDHRNRLIGITDRASSGGPATKVVSHRYDVFNRWISTEVDSDGSGPLAPNVTHYEYDGSQIVFAIDDSGTITNRYLWGPLVDQILADEQVGDQVYWPAADHLGTVRDILDSNSAVANHLIYDSFGNVVNETNAAVDHLFGYTGRPFDDASGLQNHLNRWYDPTTGRWTAEDPISFAGDDANLYRYVGNTVTTLIDQDGLAEKVVPLYRTNWTDEALRSKRHPNHEKYKEIETRWFGDREPPVVGLSNTIDAAIDFTLGQALGTSRNELTDAVTIMNMQYRHGQHGSPYDVNDLRNHPNRWWHQLLVDTATDPTTYIGAGTLKRGTSATKSIDDLLRCPETRLSTQYNAVSGPASIEFTNLREAARFLKDGKYFDGKQWRHLSKGQRRDVISGIDLLQPVQVRTLEPGTRLLQDVRIDGRPGPWFREPGTSASQVGVWSGGRETIQFQNTLPVEVLESRARPITDFWSRTGFSVPTEGGGVQYYTFQGYKIWPD